MMSDAAGKLYDYIKYNNKNGFVQSLYYYFCYLVTVFRKMENTQKVYNKYILEKNKCHL